jgi:pyruvoyl-dependent arginine decarboxylase (PvlArgDC)
MNRTPPRPAVDFNIGADNRASARAGNRASSPSPGWLMTAVASWGENPEDAFDQALVELGLGDARLVKVEGAMLPLGFEPVQPRDLPMGSLVECHLAIAHTSDGGSAAAGVAWAKCDTPEGDECAIVTTLATELDVEETDLQLRRNLKRKMASRDLEVDEFDVAVDEVTAAEGHHGVVVAALIMPESLRMGAGSPSGPTRSRNLTRPSGPSRGRNDSDFSVGL